MLIDTHCHLDDPAYQGDAAGVVQRAKDAGVGTLVTIGTDLEGSRRAVALAQQFPEVYAVVGFHPNEANRVQEDWWGELEQLARHHKVRGIGETGLDYYRNHAKPEKQDEVFRRAIRLARHLKLPLIIHTREASADTVKLLQEERGEEVGGIFHCFSGDPVILEAGKSLGFYFAVGGVMTYPKAQSARDALELIPKDRLLLETDAPYLAPQAHRGQRNESSYMVETARKVAEVLGLSFEEFERITTKNAKRFLKF